MHFSTVTMHLPSQLPRPDQVPYAICPRKMPITHYRIIEDSIVEAYMALELVPVEFHTNVD